MGQNILFREAPAEGCSGDFPLKGFASSDDNRSRIRNLTMIDASSKIRLFGTVTVWTHRHTRLDSVHLFGLQIFTTFVFLLTC
jgi:hypothetical protein